MSDTRPTLAIFEVEAEHEHTPRAEAVTDALCAADLIQRIERLLRDPKFGRRFERLPAATQNELREQSRQLYSAAIAVRHSFLAALAVPAEATDF